MTEPTDYFLGIVRRTLVQRGDTYGRASVMMRAIASSWSGALDSTITPADVCLCMILLKLERLKQDADGIDCVVDIAGYAAIYAELLADEGRWNRE